MAIIGALVNKSADQTGANYSTATNIAWDAEVYDTDGFHDTVTNNERLTIPAAYDGSFGVLTANLVIDLDSTNSNGYLFLHKNGDGILGSPLELRFNRGTVAAGSNQRWWCIHSPPLLLANGDYFTANMYLQDTSVTVVSSACSFGIRILDQSSNTYQVLCTKSADETGSDYSTAAAIPWDAEAFDTNTLHDTVTNNERITIPSALNGKYGILSASVTLGSSTDLADISIAIRKSGAGFLGGGFQGRRTTDANTWACATTQPVLLTTADYFDVLMYCSDTSIDVLKNGSNFGLRVVG